ncbi:hypothetical protein AK830_g107 [Neonectria ditissima]|uniref:FAD-binding domain-containing protein n=1 Tax=Neonectria ditissima TaxID=78410 RepID=A0A0P7BHG0_9HYPO|nr:hypothetical protein AK830_g107 [Neonectria ditissima]
MTAFVEQLRNATVNADPTTVEVIVVGLGLAGLTAAIECHRKGHSVIVLERNDKVCRTNGDGIGISPNAARVIRQWGDVDERLQAFVSNATEMNIYSPDDELLLGNPMDCFAAGSGYLIHRGTLIFVLYEYARSIGIDIRLSSSVSEYWETDEEAGVVVNGTRIAADCVICAEGIRSRGREMIMGQRQFVEEPKSAFAAFRGYLRMEELRKDPETRWFVDEAEAKDFFQVWAANGTHFSFFTAEGGEVVVWYAARKTSSLTEPDLDRHSPPKIETALRWMENWPIRDKLQPVVQKADHGFFIQTRHASQRPLKTWRSPLGRMMVTGDAAHPTPSASAQSGSQAVEDGAVLAIVLELAGKDDVPMALQVTERIRYNRASTVQFWGGVIQDTLFKKPECPPEGRPDWLWDHDCQEYTYQEYETVVDAIRRGQEYVPKNCPSPSESKGAMPERQLGKL